MRSAKPFRLVLVTAGSEKNASLLSRSLVESRLAACVNVIPQIRSIYRWKGVVEEDQEWLLIVKTKAEQLPKLTEEIRRQHTYEVPEILVLDIEKGSSPYLDWLDQEILD